MDENRRKFGAMVMSYVKDLAVVYKPDVGGLNDFIKTTYKAMMDAINEKPERTGLAEGVTVVNVQKDSVDDTRITDEEPREFFKEDEDAYFLDEKEMQTVELKSQLNHMMDAAKIPREHKKPFYDFIIMGNENHESLAEFVSKFGECLKAYRKHTLEQKSK